MLVHFNSPYQELLGECTERIEKFTSAIVICGGLFPRNDLNPFVIKMILHNQVFMPVLLQSLRLVMIYAFIQKGSLKILFHDQENTQNTLYVSSVLGSSYSLF